MLTALVDPTTQTTACECFWWTLQPSLIQKSRFHALRTLEFYGFPRSLHRSVNVFTLSHSQLIVFNFTVLTYIDVSAALNGVDSDFSFYLLSIANAASLFGRLLSGFLADRIGAWYFLCNRKQLTAILGAVNVMAPFTLLAGIMTYIWPFVRGEAAYIVIALIYGYAFYSAQTLTVH